MNKKDLTFRYAVNQALFFAAYCGALGYAATYMLAEGIRASIIGIILSCMSFSSFLLQPVIASYADKAEKNIIPKIILILSLFSFVCFSVVRFIKLPLLLFAAFYLLAILSFDVLNPLMNSIYVYYSLRSWKMHYGIARGAGSIGFAVASLFLGRLMEDRAGMLLPVTMMLILLSAVVALSYPRDESKVESASSGSRETAVSLMQFFRKYKCYTISLLGVLLLGFSHSMTENYLIEIVKRLGGTSVNLGIALFIANVAEAPGIALSGRVHKKTGTYRFFILCASFFTLKMVLYLLSPNLPVFYAASALQFCTYAMLAPIQVIYAQDCVNSADMVKGQSTIFAAFTLGSALGSLSGGLVIDSFGVVAMIILAIAVCAASLMFLIFTVPKALQAAN